MQISAQKIATNKPGSDNRKAYAARLLKEFRWTPSQTELLQQMAEKGYFIGVYNESAKVFGFNEVPNGNKRCIMVYGYYRSKPWNKKLQTLHKIN